MTHRKALLFTIIVVAGCVGDPAHSAVAPTGLPTSVGSPLPSDAPSPAPPSATAEATAAPTIGAEPTLGGEFPGPDATVPPGAPVIRDLRLADLAHLWASLGLSCESHTAGGPESPAAYNVHCERMHVAANVHFVADTAYWTTEGVAFMSLTATASDDGSIDGPAAATQWVLPFARLAGGDSAARWLQERVGDATCPDKCTEVFRGSQFSYGSGSLGTQSLHVVPPVPSR